MKWYACLNDAALDEYAEHLRVAIGSAIDIAKLEPHIVFDGDPARLYGAVGRSDFVLHNRVSALREEIALTPATPGWCPNVARGTLLRLEIPFIEEADQFVLYTDCDVLFTGLVDLSLLKPKYFAAAPGHNPDNWHNLCSGVMLLNVAAMRKAHPYLMNVARAHLGVPHFYDQEVLNTAFLNRWDRLPLEAHWKPYWGPNPSSAIVHFHGPKIAHVRMLMHEADRADLPEIYRTLYQNSVDGYAYYERLFTQLLEPNFNFARYSELQGSPHGSIARRWIHNLLSAGGRKRVPNRSGLVAPKPPPLGSSQARYEIATSKNFDEARYLAANADVALAVKEGKLLSGWKHFREHGREEGRAQVLSDEAFVTAPLALGPVVPLPNFVPASRSISPGDAE